MRFPWTKQNAMTDFTRTMELMLPAQNYTQDVEFSNITYTVQDKARRNNKTVLKNVSGKFNSGELTAIMGPSGAGKSTLLHILTGFIKNGVEGTLRHNGNVVCSGNGGFRKEACYIMQNDYLQQEFTVIELMMISANLKVGHSLSLRTKEILINDILNLIGLSMCSNTRCNRLSGGEAKRLSIALELVDNPPIMFLDEPTTGLDSASSLQSARVLKELAYSGCTVVCTVHQPCAYILELFDQVYALDKGECVYQGASYNIVPFLRQMGLECPQYHNPADFMLEVITGQHGNITKKLKEVAKSEIWKNSKTVEGTCPKEIPTQKLKEERKAKTLVLIQPPKETERFWILFKCFYIQLKRNWTISYLKIAVHIACGIILGLIFTNTGMDATKVISNIGHFYFLITYLTYTTMMPAIMRFSTDKHIVAKETFNNWYKLRTYFAALTLFSIPVQFVITMLPVTLSYYFSSQPLEFSRFSMVLFVLYMCTLIAEGIGLFIGTLCQPVMGTFFGALFTSCKVLFGGFVILFNHIPFYLYWVTYLNFFSYSFDAIITTIYGFNRGELTCPESEIYCHLSDSELVLKELSISGNLYWIDAGILLLFVTGVRIMSYYAMKCKMTNV